MSGDLIAYLDKSHLSLYKVEDKHLESAAHLIAILPEHALRTSDTLHLAIAQYHGIDRLATADHAFAKAAMALGFEMDLFA